MVNPRPTVSIFLYCFESIFPSLQSLLLLECGRFAVVSQIIEGRLIKLEEAKKLQNIANLLKCDYISSR